MKTLIKKTIATTLAIICLLAAVPATALSTDSVKYANDEKALELTAMEIEEIMTLIDTDSDEFSDELMTYEFYNENDELVLSKSFKKGTTVNDKNFVTLKAKSDFFMEIGNTSIFRLEEK